jgi:dienelactone hydrolase
MVDRWPCDPQVEQSNYRGFEYLVRRLAAAGYVALAPNINAEDTFGFGEPLAGERLKQLMDLHLTALAVAAAGGTNGFGIDLQGRADVRRLAFLGHSRGGEAASWLAVNAGLDSPDVFEKRGYGPIEGILMIAPPILIPDSTRANVPLSIILPACDGDVAFQEGKHFYEAIRQSPEALHWTTSVWLERANHNFFNTILRNEFGARPGRPDCDPLLTPEAQRDFLMEYSLDFLTAIFSPDVQARRDAESRLGLKAQSLAPSELYGLPARVSNLVASSDRLTLLVPADAGELNTNRLGGSVSADGVTTFFCEEGYYTPAMKPGSEPCRRVNLAVPGQPAMVVVSWSQRGNALRFALPDGQRDLSRFAAISLRAALDPLSPLNAPGQFQAFSVQVTDGAGKTAAMHTRPAEPALQFPLGKVEDDPFFEGGLFSGRVPITTVRLPLNDLEGVNLSDIRELALVFDRKPSGSLFIGDVEVVRSQP